MSNQPEHEEEAKDLDTEKDAMGGGGHHHASHGGGNFDKNRGDVANPGHPLP